jgi:hypothetical protein
MNNTPYVSEWTRSDTPKVIVGYGDRGFGEYKVNSFGVESFKPSIW